ncbi:MAG: glycosyltransferase [Candidatus Falkowbacteria bacterium]
MKNNNSNNLNKNKSPLSPWERGQGGEGKIALIHDHLAQLGGAEKVLQTLADIYPSAPIYTLLYKQENVDNFFNSKKIIPSFIQKMPLGIKKYQWYMPLMASAIESHDFSNFKTVISSASSFAKGIITRPETTHICYCHTPTRYLWHYNNQYLEELKMPKFIKQTINFYISRVRQWDLSTINRVDYFIANSKTTQKRIKKYYLRDSTVIYPPVDTNKFKISQEQRDYFLTGGRLTPYKRFDLAIKTFNKLGIPLKIFGEGPDLRRLKKMANNNIEFLGRISEEEKAGYLSACHAFIHPQEEDFGITAVEAMASGRPVIAFNKGGATETIIHGQTGILFNEQSWEELADVILRFLHKPEFIFNPEFIKQQAEQFNVERFKREVSEYVDKILLE